MSPDDADTDPVSTGAEDGRDDVDRDTLHPTPEPQPGNATSKDGAVDAGAEQKSEKQEDNAAAAAVPVDSQAEPYRVITKDLGFLPIPPHLQHHPDKPHKWTLTLNIVFGVASTFLVANLYYCQPLLIQLAESFGVTYNEVSRIPTLIQAGYAVGLLFISPLGDLVRRRALLLLLTFLAASLTIGLPLSRNVLTFEVLSFLVGIVTVVPQVLMPLAADLAPPHRRASALSIVLSGLLFGVLIARVLSGVIAEFASWRVVYYVAIAVQWVVLAMLYWLIPDYPQRNQGLTYGGILWSMAKFSVTEPLLIQAVLVSIASMATFSSFWVTLTFLLGGPPYYYNTLVIGLFGLVGMLGVCLAPLIGRTIDALHPWFATTIASFILILFQAVQTGAGGVSVAAVVISCFGLDVFRQMQQVSLTSSVFSLDAGAKARLNAVIVISIFIGQVMGTSVGTKVFLEHGWRASAFVSLAWCCFCFCVMLSRGPNCGRYTWVGWEGGWEVRKSRLAMRAGKGSEEKQDIEAKRTSGDTDVEVTKRT
ncbi:MFS general substrate transporter [Cristinia sonorae]|uniref:MFS general substrate transporter n=1 Tax=Cristinia sonorae TaxID=1940300 RepID=A0A8K0XM34_9AGAR|nr:MFS general substrate transporter [Cristinia sonorae]